MAPSATHRPIVAMADKWAVDRHFRAILPLLCRCLCVLVMPKCIRHTQCRALCAFPRLDTLDGIGAVHDAVHPLHNGCFGSHLAL